MTRQNESFTPLLCSYPDSEKINSISEGAEAMFCRLLAKSDDAGNYHGNPTRILCKLFTIRYERGTMTLRKVVRMRNELVTVRLVDVYVVNGVEYLHIINCKKSLRSDVKPKLIFPDYSQELVNKELPENVTDAGRKRNGCGTNSSHQSNPIQSNNNPIQHMSVFDDARKLYPGTKRGLKYEFDNFCYHHTDWKEILPLLKPAIQKQIDFREKAKGFVPNWKNFKTWINQACWSEEIVEGKSEKKESLKDMLDKL